jgi:PAS domain S-box-containing protein
MRQLLENLLAMVGVLEPDGTLIEANRRALALAGLRINDVRGRKFWECPWWTHDPDLQRWLADSVARAAAGEIVRADIVVRGRGNARIALDFMLAPLPDGDAQITQLVASAIDISSRTAGEQALRASEARFRQVVEGSPGATAVVDAQGRIVLINGALESLFSRGREELVGATVDALMPPRYRERHHDLFQTFFAAPRARDMAGRRELYALRADGSEFPVEIALNPVEVGGEGHVIATIIDVTARKTAQAALERALADKTALLGEVHHRVKNNLQVISSLLSLQQRTADPSAQEALADSQMRVRAMGLIHELLYERSDASVIDLLAYLRRLIRLLHDSVGATRSPIAVEFESLCTNGPALDPQRAVPCGLLVTELVTNAIKHAFHGRATGRVVVRIAQLQTSVCLSVDDDGTGLPESVEIGNTQSLGFQLIPMLIDQLDGELSIERGAGTRFDIVFTP